MNKFKSVPREAMRLRMGAIDGKFEMKTFDNEGIPQNFLMFGYTGKVMNHWYFGKFVVDISGVKLGKKRAILREHDPRQIVGHTTKLFKGKDGKQGIWAEGKFSMSTVDGREVARLAGDGFPWECSISIDNPKAVELEEGDEAEVNGETVIGPALIFRKSNLREISFCVSGMDGDTRGIAASESGEKVQIEYINLSQSKNEEAVMPDEKHDKASTEVEKDSAEVVADAPVEDVAVEAEVVETEEEEVEADEPKAVEPVKEDEPKPDQRKELAAELTSMVAEFGSEFALKCFTEGLTMDQAKLANYDNLKAQAAGKVAKEADGVPALDLGVKPEPVSEGDFTSEWTELWKQRNAGGESLSRSQAMEIVIKNNPDKYGVGVIAPTAKKC